MDRGDVIPETTRHFVRSLSRALTSNNVNELSTLYDVEYNKQTEKMYKQSSWPSLSSILDTLSDRDKELLFDSQQQQPTAAGTFYKELYFRHIYLRMQPELDDRFESFQNFIHLFNIILGLDEKSPELLFPITYLYDLIHTFIDQFTEFHQYRNNVRQLEGDDISILRDSGVHLWSAQSVLRYLHAFVRKANIESAAASAAIVDRDEQRPETHTQFRILGQYAIVGLLRVNTLLADYTSALNVCEGITLPSVSKGKNLFTRVPICHATLYYNISLSYLFTKRYTDAQRSALHYLSFIQRNKHLLTISEDNGKSTIKYRKGEATITTHTVEYINSIVGKLYAILGVVSILLNDNIIYDDVHANEIRDRFGDRIPRLKQSIEPNLVDDLFTILAPSYLSVAQPNFNADDNANDLMYHQQFNLFLEELKQRSQLSELISFLKLFTSIDVSKLAQFLHTSDDDILAQLLRLKAKNRIIRHTPGSNNPVAGQWVDLTDVSFYLDGSTVYVAEQPVQRRYNEFWLRHTVKLQDVNRELSRLGNIRRA